MAVNEAMFVSLLIDSSMNKKFIRCGHTENLRTPRHIDLGAEFREPDAALATRSRR
jgi:hypothetical protein